MGDFNLQPSNIGPSVTPKASAIAHFAELSSGAGSTILKNDRNGLFVGGTDFASAPWSVDYNGVQYIGADGEITIDGPNKKIVVGTGGLIQTDFLKDSTYGLNGVFVRTYHTTTTSGTITVTLSNLPANGGLLNATCNWYNSGAGTPSYNLLPGYNTATAKSYYNIQKLSGLYKIIFYASKIYSDITYTDLYFSLFFNSQEASGW